MFKELIKVFGESIVYGLTGVVSTFISVLLVPIYTRVLTPGDYGVTALLGVFSSILVVIAGMGMGSAIFWAYFRAKEKERATVVGTSFIFQTVFPFLIALAVFILSGFISRMIFSSAENSLLVKIASGTIFFQVGIMVPLALLRAEGSPKKYIAITLTNVLATVFFSIILVVVLRVGVLGVFLANLFGPAIAYLLGLYFTIRRISFNFSFHWLKEMLSFGVPMVPAGLAMWILNSSDRYFLKAFTSNADVGIYNVGYRIGMLVTLVSGALQLAYPRFMFSIYNDKPNPQDYFKRINTYFYLLIFTFALGISIFSKEAVQVLTGSAFHSSYVVVPLVAFSYVAYGLYQNFGTGVTVVKKTYFSAIATLIAGGLNLILNYVLISRFGMMGAAVSTLLSFTALALIELVFSQRVYPITFEFRKLFTVLISGGVLVYVSTIVDFGLAASIIVKFLILAAFPVLLYFLKFFEERELRKLAKIWNFVKSSRGQPRKLLDSIKQELIT